VYQQQKILINLVVKQIFTKMYFTVSSKLEFLLRPSITSSRGGTMGKEVRQESGRSRPTTLPPRQFPTNRITFLLKV